MPIPTPVLLIDQDYINQFTHLNKSVEWAYLKPSILDAQAIRLQPVLGTDLYQKIIDDVAAATIAGNYLTLLQTHIMPVVMYWAMYEAVPFLKVKIDNGGLVERTSETTNPAGKTDTDTIRDSYREKAEFMQRRMVDFICHNSGWFPQYNTNKASQLSSNGGQQSITMGIVNRTRRSPMIYGQNGQMYT